MQDHHDREIQQAIITELATAAHFDAEEDLRRRIEFLADYLSSSGLTTLILGISGGIDSTTTGRMAQLAVEKLRGQGEHAEFLAMRLPYGVQRDEADAQTALQFIRPDRTITIDIKPAADGMLAALVAGESNDGKAVAPLKKKENGGLELPFRKGEAFDDLFCHDRTELFQSPRRCTPIYSVTVLSALPARLVD